MWYRASARASVPRPVAVDTGVTTAMIKLTRLGGEPFILNAELIRYVEARPDTFITLTSGERLVVREAMDEVVRRAVDYQRSKHLISPPVRAVSSQY
jgi:flagellar protein FlbD